MRTRRGDGARRRRPGERADECLRGFALARPPGASALSAIVSLQLPGYKSDRHVRARLVAHRSSQGRQGVLLHYAYKGHGELVAAFTGYQSRELDLADGCSERMNAGVRSRKRLLAAQQRELGASGPRPRSVLLLHLTTVLCPRPLTSLRCVPIPRLCVEGRAHARRLFGIGYPINDDQRSARTGLVWSGRNDREHLDVWSKLTFKSLMEFLLAT
jgi:hypothetical protein